MKEAIIALVLLGCDCDGRECEYIETVSRDWATLESCERASLPRGNQGTGSYPLIIAQCAVERSAPEPVEIVLADLGAPEFDDRVQAQGWSGTVAGLPGRARSLAVRGYASVTSVFTAATALDLVDGTRRVLRWRGA